MTSTHSPLQDPVIHHLPLALDSERMTQMLQDKVFSALDILILRCEITRIKYQPGKNCLVCYCLQWQKNQAGSAGKLWLSARFYESGGSHSRYAKAEQDQRPQTAITLPLIHLPELDCLIWVFPNDRKLASLALIQDHVALGREVLPHLVTTYWGQHWRFSQAHSERVHYLPEHTCCVRTRFTLTHTVTGEVRHPVLYGKTYYNDQGRNTMAAMVQLWRSPARQQGRLAIPQPIAYLAPWKMLWQSEVAGIPALDGLRNQPDFQLRMSDIADSVAALHQTLLEHLQTACANEQPLAQLQRVLYLVLRVKPEYARPMEVIIGHLCRTLPDSRTRPVATLHGDLHLKNVLINERQAFLIDLDNLYLGDPLRDIGSLIASLLYLPLLGQLEKHQTHRLIALFLHYYQRHIHWRIPTNDLCWYVAAALLTERLTRSITRLKEGRLDKVPALLELAGTVTLGNTHPEWLAPLKEG